MSTKSFLGTFICLVVLSKCCIAVEVTIDQGTLRGSSYLSRNGTKYHGFLSIPFAKPPVGELRFEVIIFRKSALNRILDTRLNLSQVLPKIA